VAHKYPNILIHLVFSTKERAKLIPTELLPRLAKYFAGIGRNHGIPLLAVGGISNHVHLLIALPSDMTPAKAVQVLKANSSRWIRQHGITFTWQARIWSVQRKQFEQGSGCGLHRASSRTPSRAFV
jgi:putative transposase